MSVVSDDFEGVEVDSRGEVQQVQLKRIRAYYPSNQDAYYIVNAMTGVRYPWKVGSYESHRLYKVTDASGFNDRNGYRLQKNDEPNYEPNFLYYDSPEQASKHLRMKLDAKRSLEWHNRYKLLFPEGEFSIDAFRSLQGNV
jgi:hypothetical protein